jgi:uncharacterized protein (DUF2267 family)
VQYDDVVSSVRARSGRPRDETETLVHATLRVRAQRLTAGEADDLRAQLPRDAVEPGEFDDLASQVGEQLARLVPGSR